MKRLLYFFCLILALTSQAQDPSDSEAKRNVKAIIERATIEGIKNAFFGLKTNPVAVVILEFLRTTPIVNDSTEMSQLKEIKDLEKLITKSGKKLDQFYSDFDNFMKKNSTSLCDDPIYKIIYKCK